MMKKTMLFLLGALCATPPAAARQITPPATIPDAPESLRRVTSDDEPVLSLADAVALARERHPGMEAAAGMVMTTRGAARQLGAFPNPEVEWRGESLNTALEPDKFLTATLPLDLAGRRFALRSSGRAAGRGARADSLALIRAVEFRAATTFWEAALAEALLDAAITQRLALQGIAEYDAIRLREGAVAEGTALRTRLEADRARIAEATARSEFARARAELARALGVPADNIPRLEPLIPNALAAAEGGLAPYDPGTPPSGQKALGEVAGPGILATLMLPTLEDALERARAERPELLAASAAVDAARLRRSAERRALIPEIGVTGGVKTTAGVSGAVIGITMPFPLFDRNGGARELAAGELRIAEAHRRKTEAAITAEVTATLEAVEALLAALPAEDRDLGRRGREIAQIIEAAYREGGATLVELLEAQRAAADAYATALRWHTDLRLALLELNRATGAQILENQS
jgi:cobalt-zinc-cadmium efflux system outer membrane protein